MSKVAVYDFRTVFKVSVLSITDGAIETLASNRNVDPGIGTDAMDIRIADFLQDQVFETYHLDLKKLPRVEYLDVRQRIETEAQNVRRAFVSGLSYEVSLPFLATYEGITVSFTYMLSRSKFEQLTLAIVEKTIDPCRRALSDAHIVPSDLDSVQLTGEGARLPAVYATAEKIFGLHPQYPSTPEDATVLAAAWMSPEVGGATGQERPAPAEVTVSAMALGSTVRGALAAGACDYWRFDATAGTQVRIDMTAISGTLSVYLQMSGPDGSGIADTYDSPGAEVSMPALLPEDGTYVISACARDETSGDYRLMLVDIRG